MTGEKETEHPDKSGGPIVDRLIAVYGEEELLYRRFVSLTEKLVELSGKETAPGEIGRLVSERQDCLARTAALDRTIESEKAAWEKARGELPGDRARLKELIGKIHGHIERALELDKKVESGIHTRLDSLKSELNNVRRTRKAHKAYLKKDDGSQTGLTRARA